MLHGSKCKVNHGMVTRIDPGTQPLGQSLVQEMNLYTERNLNNVEVVEN